ncbi:MAG: precorrin-2 dehydrogenase/sirohydrochlorin ferrochelatase family protein [Acidimicrobiia bacterium]
MSLPVALHLAHRRCVVVGGGRIANRKVRALLEAGATDVTVVAPIWSTELRALEADARVTLIERMFFPSDLDQAWLVCSATDNADVARAVANAAEERRVWCNAAELPEVSSWSGAAVIRRGDITVSVATDGQSPAFTTWLRDRLDADLGPEFGELCALVAERRAELKAQGVPTESCDWRNALDGGVLDLVRDGRIEDARELLRACP